MASFGAAAKVRELIRMVRQPVLTTSAMPNDLTSNIDSDDENFPLFDENTTPRSLRRVCVFL